MIKITSHVEYNEHLNHNIYLYRVEYWLEGVRASSMESEDLAACLKEIRLKMAMDMGHMKGKLFTTKTGNEL